MKKKAIALSMESGGVYGIIHWVMLQHLEKKCIEFSGQKDFRLADHIDCYAGISAGFLNSALISEFGIQNGYRIFREIFDEMKKHSSSVETAMSNVQMLYQKRGNAAQRKAFEKILQKHFGERTLKTAKKPLLGMALNHTTEQPLFFTEEKIWQAIRATTGHQIAIAPVLLPSGYASDGGMFCKSISMHALYYLSTYTPIQKKILISLGSADESFLNKNQTGENNSVPLVKDHDLSFVMHKRNEQASSWHELIEQFSRIIPDTSAFYFNCANTINVSPDDLNAFETIEKMTQEYCKIENRRFETLAKQIVA